MAFKAVYEIFEEFNKAPTKEEKKKVLLANDTEHLKFVLQGTFHPEIQWVFKHEIPYNPCTETLPGITYQNIYDVMKKTYIWVEGSKKVNPTLRYQRKEILFIQTLEALEPKEAKVVMNMVLKDQKIKGLTYALVEETFPGLLPSKE